MQSDDDYTEHRDGDDSTPALNKISPMVVS
jgi:hypothetical protein